MGCSETSMAKVAAGSSNSALRLGSFSTLANSLAVRAYTLWQYDSLMPKTAARFIRVGYSSGKGNKVSATSGLLRPAWSLSVPVLSAG